MNQNYSGDDFNCRPSIEFNVAQCDDRDKIKEVEIIYI